MGAADFVTSAQGKNAREAFSVARQEALWEYGHGGYTGTIAEKDGFVDFGRLPAGVGSREFFNAVMERIVNEFDDEDGPFHHDLNTPVHQFISPLMIETFDDKWGPAVCVQVRDDAWLFCGMASE